jgi:signal transduction histidine kinase
LYTAIAESTAGKHRISLYRDLIEVLLMQEELDAEKILYYGNLALAESGRYPTTEHLPYFYNTVGYIYKHKLQYDIAIVYVKKGLEVAKLMDSPKDIARGGYTLGILYLDQQMIEEAIEQIKENFYFLRKHPNDYYSQANYLLMAYLTLSADNYQLFQHFYQKASEYMPDASAKVRIKYEFQIRNQLLAGNKVGADALLRELLDKYPSHRAENISEITEIYLNIADAYVAKGHYQQGVDLLVPVLSAGRAAENHALLKSKALAARAYIHLGDLDRAEALNRQALSQMNYSVLMDHRLMSMENEVLLRQRRGHFQEAMLIMDKVNKYRDSLSLAKSNKNYLLVSLLQNYDALEKDFDSVKLENLAQKELLERDSKIRILLLVLLVVLILFSAIVIGFYKKLEEKRLEVQNKSQELARQAEDLLEANAVKDKLLSLIGHELRSPVAELISILDVKKRISKYESAIHYLESIRLKSKNVYQTLDNILTWSASNLRVKSLKTAPLEIEPVVRMAVDFAGESIMAKDIQVHIDVEEVKVMGLKNEILIVLRNILHNAIKFSPEGGAIYFYTEGSEEQVELVVEDEGEGMSEELQRNLFSTIQNSAVGTSGEKGTGVGLYICADLMRQQDGEIRSECGRNGGTAIRLVFVRAESAVEVENLV